MKPMVTELANGLRVASQRMDHVESVSLGVWVAAGSRHETKAQHGLSHLLEHMAFKGTRTRSAQRIAEEIEEAGGDLNAATGLDTTAYYARVLKTDIGLALEILADILLNSVFSREELEKECDVILQEIAAAQDSPEDQAYDLLSAAAYPNQPVGRPILGTPESVCRLKAGDLRRYLASRYHPEDMVIAAAGAVSHKALVRHVEALFGGLNRRPKVGDTRARYRGGVAASNQSFEQSHILVGFQSPAYGAADYPAAQVFSGLLGGGMSSRLFQEIREKRGLCYAIYSSVWGLKDTGMFTIHAATGAGLVDQLVPVVAEQLGMIAEHGPAAAELQRSKAQLRAGLLMGLESSTARAEHMARQLLAHNRIISTEEIVARVDDVSIERVRTLADAMARSPASITVVGSGRKSKGQAHRAARLFAPHRVQPLASRS